MKKGLLRKFGFACLGFSIVLGVGIITMHFKTNNEVKADNVLYTMTTSSTGTGYDNGNGQKGVGSYTATWSITTNGTKWTIENFNSNYSQGTNWANIRCGRKSNASVASITSPTITEKIGAVEITISNISATSAINSAKVYGGTDGSTVIGNIPTSAGTHKITVSNPTVNWIYKFEFDCKASTNSNGFIQVSSVKLYDYSGTTTYSVTYNGNGNNAGLVPTDSNSYTSGAEVTVLAKPETLVKNYYSFTCWNTKADGSGTNYSANDKFSITADTTLYAKWTFNHKYSHAGTLADPFGAIDAVAKAYETGSTATTDSYYISGVVTESSFDTTWGNFNITITENDVDFIGYRLYDGRTSEVEQTKFTKTSDIQVDDTVVIHAPIVLYNGTTPETSSGYYVTSITKPAGKTVSSIAITGTATKTAYTTVDQWDHSGLTVTATYSNSDTEDVTSSVSWTNDPETPNNTSITSVTFTASFTYEGKTVTTDKSVSVTVEQGTENTDKLTSSLFTATKTAYTDFTDVSVSTSAVYAGNTSKGTNDVIQIRSKSSNSGIVTTTSGGKIRKVTLEWGSGNTSGRIISVYGKDEAYTSASDLYSKDTVGEFVGKFVYDVESPTTVVEALGDYTYIGIRSNDGTVYLNNINVEWYSESASDFADSFIELLECDATGATAPSVDDWNDLGLMFAELGDYDKTIFQDGVSNAEGAAAHRALAKYDYIIAKYGTTNYSNFMNRTVSSSARINPISNITAGSTATIVIIVIAATSLTIIGCYFFYKKRRENI